MYLRNKVVIVLVWLLTAIFPVVVSAETTTGMFSPLSNPGGDRQGEYPGMLANRKFNIRLMTPDASGAGMSPKTVEYDGKSASVKL